MFARQEIQINDKRKKKLTRKKKFQSNQCYWMGCRTRGVVELQNSRITSKREFSGLFFYLRMMSIGAANCVTGKKDKADYLIATCCAKQRSTVYWIAILLCSIDAIGSSPVPFEFNKKKKNDDASESRHSKEINWRQWVNNRNNNNEKPDQTTYDLCFRWEWK